MKQSPLIILEASIEERVTITYQEYIIESLSEHQKYYDDSTRSETGFKSWEKQLQTSIDKIQRRLGGVRYKEIKALLTDAIQHQKLTGNSENHKQWIRILLVDYYDPMYDFQTEKKLGRVIFKGTQDEVLGYLKTQYQIS